MTTELRVVERGEDLTIDARQLVDVVGPAALEAVKASILASVDPETGAPKPGLGERAARAPRVGGRGVRTGHLARALALKITGGQLQARARIAVPDDRRDFVYTEAARGVQYLSTGGTVEAAVNAALADDARGQRGR